MHASAAGAAAAASRCHAHEAIVSVLSRKSEISSGVLDAKLQILAACSTDRETEKREPHARFHLRSPFIFDTMTRH